MEHGVKGLAERLPEAEEVVSRVEPGRLPEGRESIPRGHQQVAIEMEPVLEQRTRKVEVRNERVAEEKPVAQVEPAAHEQGAEQESARGPRQSRQIMEI